MKKLILTTMVIMSMVGSVSAGEITEQFCWDWAIHGLGLNEAEAAKLCGT